MNVGATLIVLGAITALGAAVFKWLSHSHEDKRLGEISAVFSIVTFATVSAALVLLMGYFLTSNMSYDYVWSNSSTDLSSVYKLSGVWAGSQGSFLLWIWFMSLVLAAEVLLEPRRKYLSSKFHVIFQVALSGVIFSFMLILVDMNLFARTNSLLLDHYPNGWGMSLLLQTPEMVIHPPVVFGGYAFCIVAFAASLAYFVTDDKNWFKVSLPWTRLGWIFLTLGIGIGAIWAYYVLGWGGYWAWDPVETSSLLPWLIATAFLHTLIRNVKKDEYTVSAPMLGMLSFVAVIFATFATRAGSIWTSSVHNFGSSVGSTGVARLGYLLNHDATVLGIFSLMLALFVMTVLFAYLRYRDSHPHEDQPEPESITEYVSDKNNMLLTVLLLVIVSMVIVLLLFKNVNVSQAANYDEFNQKLSIFFVGLMATMSVCMIWKFVGKRPAFFMGAGLIVLSIAIGVGAIVTGAASGLVAFSIPSYALAIGTAVYRLSRSGVRGSLRKTLQNASPHLIHVGVALVLLAYIVSSSMQVYAQNSELIQGVRGNLLGPGEGFKVGGYTVKLISLSESPENKVLGTTIIESSQQATVQITTSGGSSTLTMVNMYGVSNGKEGVIHVDVHIHKSLMDDLYLNFAWMSNSSALVQAKVVPLMNFLWAGFGLLVIGLVLRTVSWSYEAKESIPSGKEKKGTAPRPAGPKDYESIVEEELRKFKEKKKSKD